MKSLHIGSATIDVITLVASENIERASFTNDGKSFLMLEAGRKVPAQSITTHVGGGACNTAVGLARRGWQAAVLAKVGEDLNADAVRAYLAERGVGERLVACDRATGIAVIVASHDRNASIFVHRGANEALAVVDLPAFDGLDLVYIAPLSSDSADCFPEIARRARAAGAMVAANPGIRQLTSRTRAFLDALGDLDFVSVNRVEAEALVPALAGRAGGAEPPVPGDAPPLQRRGLAGGGFEIGLVGFLRAFRAAGPKWVVVTDGTDGAYLAGPDGVHFQPAVPVEVAGTAGAGDAFSSTLAAGLAEGLAPGRALIGAAVNAAAAVSRIDTTDGLLAPDELAARVAAASAHGARQIAG